MSPEDLDAHREHVARHAVHFSTDSRTALDWCAKRTRDALAAQLSALRPVVEAARKWAIHADGARMRLNERETALREALRTYESQLSEKAEP